MLYEKTFSAQTPMDCSDPPCLTHGMHWTSNRTTPGKPGGTPKKRATEYSQHRIAERPDQAYAYEDARLRKNVSLSAYVKNIGGGVKWLQADIQKVVIDGNRGEVTVTIRFINPMANYIPKEGRKRTIADRWVFEDNDWYHLIGRRE